MGPEAKLRVPEDYTTGVPQEVPGVMRPRVDLLWRDDPQTREEIEGRKDQKERMYVVLQATLLPSVTKQAARAYTRARCL